MFLFLLAFAKEWPTIWISKSSVTFTSFVIVPFGVCIVVCCCTAIFFIGFSWFFLCWLRPRCCEIAHLNSDLLEDKPLWWILRFKTRGMHESMIEGGEDGSNCNHFMHLDPLSKTMTFVQWPNLITHNSSCPSQMSHTAEDSTHNRKRKRWKEMTLKRKGMRTAAMISISPFSFFALTWLHATCKNPLATSKTGWSWLQHPNLPAIGYTKSILIRDSRGRDSFTKDTLLSALD